jgi:hypothetical protein
MNRREFFNQSVQATAAVVVSGDVAAVQQAEPTPAISSSWEERVQAAECPWDRPPGRKGPEPSPEEAWAIILLGELSLALQAVVEAHTPEHPGEWCAFCHDCHFMTWSIGSWHSLLSSIRWGGPDVWKDYPELTAVCERIRREACPPCQA